MRYLCSFEVIVLKTCLCQYFEGKKSWNQPIVDLVGIGGIGGFDSFAEILFEIKIDVGNRVDSLVTVLTN